MAKAQRTINTYNEEVVKGNLAHEKFVKGIKDPAVKNYINNLNGTTASVNGLTAATQKMTAASKAAAIGLRGLNVAMNMGVMMVA